MSTSWGKRKSCLNTLLDQGDVNEDLQALALDRVLHGQTVIGKTSRTSQIDELKFSDNDLIVVGTLEYGQYGVIDVVTCKLDGKVYARKSIEKRFALKVQDQCSPQTERDILLRALKSQTPWAPHLLCAFQSPTHVSLVMEYAEGGTLWDVLESSPHDGRILERDILWWAPQIVSAIQWCHSQGFVHRDIKPHNFVLNASSRILLIDFGSAAPLLSVSSDGSQQVPKRHCLVPCGTCDYISPEILRCHEEALVALEMSDSPQDLSNISDYVPGGYGRETDWWSCGAMLYEMAYGATPFFASDIRQTYLKIMDHQRSLRFPRKILTSPHLQDLVRRLLTTSELRLGRESVQDIMDHPFFEGIDWDTLLERPRPEDIHLPQFTYSAVVVPEHDATVVSQRESSDESNSRAFAFSALFLSSPMSEPAISVLHPTPSQKSNKSSLREQTVASFIGFSWGPLIDAFKDAEGTPEENHRQRDINTPRPLKHTLASLPLWTPGTAQATPQRLSFMTPIRPSGMTPYHTLPRTGTIRRTAPRRAVSDREAMKQLVDCVGMSARKKVLESGRKPRTLKSLPGSRSSTLKELRFDRSVMVLGGDTGVSYRMDPFSASGSAMGMSTLGLSASSSLPENMTVVNNLPLESDLDSSTATDVPYSPSPSPRPGSALSMMSRRSHATTVSVSTTTGSYLLRRSGGGMPSSDSRGMLSPIPMDSLTPVEGYDLHNTGSGGSLSYVTLDEFDKRHTRLMEDILDIRSRLGQVSVRMTGYT